MSAFPLNHAVTFFWLTAHTLHLTGFSIPYKQSQKGRGFSNTVTFNTLKNKCFSNITNCLIVRMENNTNTIITSAAQIVEYAQTVFRQLLEIEIGLTKPGK